MNKDVAPSDFNGDILVIGDYVKYKNKTWEIVDHEDSEQPAYDDKYVEHANLLLACRSHDHENIWVPDYDVEQADYQQSYFEL